MIRPFFFWCNKVLPLVYDDSLSYYELLAKVVNQLNKVAEQSNKTSEGLQALAQYVNDYLTSDEFKAYIEEELDKMAEDGTLNAMLSEISNSTKFIPSDDEHSAYVSGVSAAIADWFSNMAPGTSDSVTGSSTSVSQKYAAIYNDDYSVLFPNLLTYDAIVDNVWSFGKDPTLFPDTPVDSRYDSINVSGLTYPVMYMNCAGFVTMITKGRAYSVSPWLKLYTDADATGKELAVTALEYGDMDEAPWTVDFMNTCITWRMAGVMKGSGCTPKLIASKSAGGLTSFEDALQYLRDGDVVFCGNPADSNYAQRYLSIHHCAIYFKTLQSLNAAGQLFGIQFKPWDDSTDVSHGYLVHCTSGSGSGSPSVQNVIRIDTLDSYMTRVANNEKLYGCQISANAMNSSKEYLAVTGIMPLYNADMNPGARHNFRASASDIDFNTVRAFTSGTNNGTFSYGQYRYAQPTISIAAAGSTVDLDNFVGPRESGIYLIDASNVTITHGPTDAEAVLGDDVLTSPTSLPLLLEVHDCFREDQLSLQALTVISSADASYHKWERTVNFEGTSSKWRQVY